MEIVIGDYNHSVKINADAGRAAVSLDKSNKLTVVLGINRVQIEYINGSWTLTHGANVISKLLPQSDDAAFCEPCVDMVVFNSPSGIARGGS